MSLTGNFNWHSPVIASSLSRSALQIKLDRNPRHAAVIKLNDRIEALKRKATKENTMQLARELAQDKEVRNFLELDTAHLFRHDTRKMLPNVLFDHILNLSPRGTPPIAAPALIAAPAGQREIGSIR